MGVIPSNTGRNAEIGTQSRPFGKELHRRLIASWLSAVSDPSQRRCSVNPEQTSSGAIG